MNSVAAVRFKNSKWLFAVVAGLIVLGTVNSIFAIIALGISAALIVLSNQEDNISFFMFILPFANIFKTSPGTQSFFTYLILFYVAYMGITKRRIDIKFLVAIGALMVVLLAQSYSSFNSLRLIKFIANFLLIYGAMKLNAEKSHKGIFLSYILGVIVSSVIALGNFVPNLAEYTAEKNLGLANDWLVRFSGFYGDPNYYAVNVILSICLIVILWHRGEMNPFLAVAMSGALVYFSILTYSKSALLMLFLPMLLFVYSNIKNRKYFWAIVVACGLGYVIVLALMGKISALDMVMSRFSEGQDATTGRGALWESYIEFFRTNPYNFVLGNGLGAPLIDNTAPHNTYIDFFYYLGIIGVAIISVLFLVIPKPKMTEKRNFMNYGALICVGVMYFFLSEIFYLDFPFHLIIVMIAMNISMNHKKS